MPETVKRRPPRSDRARESRAEARRRARRFDEESAAEDVSDDGSTRAVATTTPRDRQPSLIRRLLLPPAAPLPDKPDPLAGFTHSGPRWRRGLAAGVYLLRAQPLVWVAAGVLWAIARLLESQPNAIGLAASLVAFGALIGAGYLGWQAPWLYGLASALVGAILLIAFGYTQLLATGLDPLASAGTALFAFFLYYAPFYGAMGTLAGWFGGYWRRRLAETKAQALRGQAARQAARRRP